MSFWAIPATSTIPHPPDNDSLASHLTGGEIVYGVTLGAMILFAGVANILQRKVRRRELALRKAAEEAARCSELTAETERLRSSLLSAASHDLKTPLASILAAGTTLLERRAELDDPAIDELLSAVVLEAERLSRLVHDLLSITRLESDAIVLRKTAESIEEIASVAVARLRAQGVASTIRSDFDEELPLVLVDPTLIEQLLINLMTNAVRHAGPKSPIELSAITLGDQLLIRVADRGPGIPRAERARVFDKFYQSPGAGATNGGIGLGLSICRAIVTAHGGAIEIAEREGGGASVEFTLPALNRATGRLERGVSAS